MSTVHQTIRTCDVCSGLIGDDEYRFKVEAIRPLPDGDGRKYVVVGADAHMLCLPPVVRQLFNVDHAPVAAPYTPVAAPYESTSWVGDPA
jgi:hypothetical protein